jgi:gentisate 1,2-dioxygenase
MDRHTPHALGTRDELPAEYLDALTALNLAPLWPSLRDALPFGAPNTRTRPTHWSWQAVRPLLLRAGELTPMDKAERRVIVLCNPGRGIDNLQASAAIYLGMQLVLPGEVAPNHRHTPNAVRIVVEGEGGCTIVEGEKCPMERGDLILTPTGLWHEHHHAGSGPLIWLDVLDLPLILALDRSYCTPGTTQAQHAARDGYRGGGVAPVVAGRRSGARYPLLRYEWRRTEEALRALAATTAKDATVQVAYVNPETGGDVLNTLAFTALMLRPGETVALPRISPSRVFHVVEGEGDADVDGNALRLDVADTFCAPGLASIRIANRSATRPLFLIGADESPVHRKLGLYEEHAA